MIKGGFGAVKVIWSAGTLIKDRCQDYESFHPKLGMEWKMHHWKDLAKLCKVTSNEHHENWTPKAPK